jgi:hypothetical protein
MERKSTSSFESLLMIEQKITEHTKPWVHYTFEDFFPFEYYEHLLEIPTLESDYTNITGYRDVIDNRVFISNEYVEQNPHLKPMMDLLNDKEQWEKFGVELDDGLLRVELIDDRYPFFHDIHYDTPEKLITIIVNISKEDKKNLATDLYIDKDTHYKKLDWEDNSALLFVPTENKFHGFDRIEYEGIRRIMIINFVDKNQWRDKEQCYY